eukprot:Hpha_TRINITY_DN11620_c0_g1::TRINITY_DN11620_c0_g1_i1::g.49031::m.49031/K15423/PPP4C; serine/threonine-protein phosphatase 4 catalytic subunit
MASGGGDVEELSLQAQQFPRIVELWGCYEELYPREKPGEGAEPAQSGSPGDDAQAKAKDSGQYPEDALLLTLYPVIKSALHAVVTSAREAAPSDEVAIKKDDKTALLFEDKRADRLLAGSGWKFIEGADPIWQLVQRERQLLQAALNFVEHKLGKSAPEKAQSESYSSYCSMMVPDELPTPDFLDEPPQVDLTDALVDELIASLRDTKAGSLEKRLPGTEQTKAICHRARQILVKEPNVLIVDAPATLVGDIHGQYWDLLHQIFDKGGDPANTRYVFLGDFVDRGENSLLCLDLILLLKIKYPNNIFLLRGNHESRITNNMYGFHEECRVNYPAAAVNHDSEQTSGLSFTENGIWYLFNHLFDAMPLAALVGERVFCCHGGLSPQLETLDRMLTFDRVRDIVPPGPMADITWSDPGMCEGWRINARGSGWLFGEDVSQAFCQANNLKFICRAHQCVRDGYRWDHKDRVVTVFSAPNYCWQQNKGAILKLMPDLRTDFEIYEWTQVEICAEDDEQKQNQYFDHTEEDQEDKDKGSPPPEGKDS